MGELEKYRQHLLRQTQQTDVGASNKDSVKFNKKLLDYDYGSDDDDGNHNNMTSSPHLQSQPMQGPSLIDVSISLLILIISSFLKLTNCPLDFIPDQHFQHQSRSDTQRSKHLEGATDTANAQTAQLGRVFDEDS